MSSLSPRIDSISQNLVINGSMEYWQRGTSFAAPATNAYTADRFNQAKSGAGVYTVSQSSDVPPDPSFTARYSMQVQVTTGSGALGANDFYQIRQIVEGTRLSKVIGKRITISFWVKSAVTGIHTISVRNSSGSSQFSQSYTVIAANTWEKKRVSVYIDPGQGWVVDNSAGMQLVWCMAAGSSQLATLNAWQPTVVSGGTGQVNAMATIGNQFKLALVQAVVDDQNKLLDPDFTLAGKDLADELTLCQRYFEKSNQLTTAPANGPNGTTFANAGEVIISLYTYNINPGAQSQPAEFKSRKRINPNIILYGNNTGQWQQNDGTNGASVWATWLASAVTESRFNLFLNVALTFGQIRGHWAADAEL